MRRPPAAPSRTRRTLARPTGPVASTSAPSINKDVDDPSSLSDSLAALKISTNTTKRPLPRSLVAAAKKVPVPGDGGSTNKAMGGATSKASGESSSKPGSTIRAKPTTSKASPSSTKASLTGDASPAERAKASMRLANTSLATLSSLNKGGFRATTASTPKKREEIEKAAEDAGTALNELRNLIHRGSISHRIADVEKVAGRLTANLVEMEMYLLALPHLSAMRTSILSLYSVLPPVPPTPTSNRLAPGSQAKSLLSYASLLAIPLPPASFFDPPTLSEALGLVTLSSDDGTTASTTTPKAARPTPDELIPLVLALQQYTLGCLFRTEVATPEEKARRVLAVAKYLTPEQNDEDAEGPLAWRRLWERFSTSGDDEVRIDGGKENEKELTTKRLDGMMNSMFGSLTKGLLGAEEHSSPQTLLSLRTLSILYYLTTLPSTSPPSSITLTKLTSIQDHLRKTLLLFGRTCEASTAKKYGASVISESMKDAFERALKVFMEKGFWSNSQEMLSGDGGKVWIGVCEILLHVAKRAEDQLLVERVSTLMGSSSDASSSVLKKADPEVQASQLCAKLVAVIGLLEKFSKGEVENSSIAEHLRRTVIFLPILTRLRSQPLSPSTHNKIDKAIERLRYIAVRKVQDGKRSDQLIGPSGVERREDSEAGKELLRLLDALTEHVENLHRASSGNELVAGIDALYSSALDSLIVLAYSRLVVEDRASYTPAYASLERCLPLLSVAQSNSSPPSITSICLTHHVSIRSLASAYYNIGGTLFNESKPEAAARFVRRACELSQVTIDEDKRQDSPFEPEEASNERQQRSTNLTDLRRHMTKRWELLALVQHGIGQKKLAYEAYVSAILAHSVETLDQLASDAASIPISTLVAREACHHLSKLVSRATKLATFDLLLPGSQILLKSQLDTRGFDRKAVALIMELQVTALDSGAEKVEARNALLDILKALLKIYTEEEFPLRRARTLVRLLQHEYLPSSSDATAAPDSRTVDALCSREDLGLDSGLRQFAAQYSAMAFLWAGFRAHQAQLVSSGDATFTSARQALQILRTALDSEISPSPSAPKRFTQSKGSPPQSKPTTVKKRPPPVKAPGTAARNAFKTPVTSRTLPGRSAAMKAALVTPPSRTPLEITERTVAQSSNGNDSLLLDDAERCYSQLETMAHLLGALGYSLLRMSYLKFLRRLSGRVESRANEGFITASASLGHEYVRLGKMHRAGIVYGQAESRIQSLYKAGIPLSLSAQVSYYSHYAEYLAMLGAHDRSAQAYAEALLAADSIPEGAGLSTVLKILERTQLLLRVTNAAIAMSTMLQRRGDLARALSPALQAVRTGTRALHNIARLLPKDGDSGQDRTTPFVARSVDPNAPLADRPNPVVQRKNPSVALNGSCAAVGMQVVESLATALLRVSTLHALRGNPKFAEHFAGQTCDLGRDLGSSRIMARALAVRVEVRLNKGQYQSAQDDLDEVDTLLGSATACPEAIDARRLRADLHKQMSLDEEAHLIYIEAQKSLDLFVRAANAGEVAHAANVMKGTPSPARNKMLSPPQHSALSPASERLAQSHDSVLPALHAYLVRMRVEHSRMENKPQECQALLRTLSRYAVSEDAKADEYRLLASIQFQDLLLRFSSDPVLGMLPESVLSMPPLSTSVAKPASPRSGASFMSSLNDIDTLLANALTFSTSRAPPTKLRHLSLFAASLRALQSSVGKSSKRAASSVAATLDLGLAVTLRREMLDAIEHKLGSAAAHDDLIWPALELKDSTPPSSSNLMRQFWLSARERYRLESAEPALTERAISTLLPSEWTVVSIHLSPQQDAVMLVRQRRDEEPLFFKLPLDRVARREGEDVEESFTYEAAVQELRAVIAAGNEGSQRAKHVDGQEAKAQWWKERRELDERLKLMTEQIEDVWLGAFKSVFLDARGVPATAFTTFRASVEKVLKRSIVRSQDKKAMKFKLDDQVLGCLAALSPKATEADIEDFFYFMMESFQFTGVPVAYDEVDVDQVVIDLRMALEALHSSDATKPSNDEHIFLLLDKTLQSFPWESIPCLRNRSVSRLPSLSFLSDRLDLASALSSDNENHHEIIVNSNKATIVLNPGGDLLNTQKAFEGWLNGMKKNSGWNGIVGRAPSPEEMKVALGTKDLFIYMGHGGAEQYLRTQEIRHLSRCATTLLWGCSSGVLKDQGEYDPVGTPYSYMMAGCPALVANLWDVTDKDIDKFSQNVFQSLGLFEPDCLVANTFTTTPTLTSAVATARQVCNLRYLNGAAPVVYGVPVRFSKI